MPDELPLPDDERIRARAEGLLAEEEEVGSDDPQAQAAAILEESDEREFERDDPTGRGLERRRSEDTVELPAVSDEAGQEIPKP
jgi:hypothetical protein